MKKLIENLAALIKVKTLITFVVAAVFAVLALRGDIAANEALIIVSMVMSFYFGTQHERSNAADKTAVAAPSAEPVAVIEEKATPVTAGVDKDTYSHIHPDSE